MFKRSWVWILAPYTGWTIGHFFTLICFKNCFGNCFKKTKNKQKEAGDGLFSKNIFPFLPFLIMHHLGDRIIERMCDRGRLGPPSSRRPRRPPRHDDRIEFVPASEPAQPRWPQRDLVKPVWNWFEPVRSHCWDFFVFLFFNLKWIWVDLL